MKKWNEAEIAALLVSVADAASVSKGIRNFMADNPNRSFQACSHVYYKVKKESLEAEDINIPHEEALPPAEVVNEACCSSCLIDSERVSLLTWLKNLFKKLFRKA